MHLGGGATGTDDDTLYVQSNDSYAVVPDSVTLSGFSTTPDGEYLKQMQDSGTDKPNVDLDTSDGGGELSEFDLTMGVDLGSMELAVTDAVTILVDGDKIGFAIGLPIAETGKDGGKGFAESNKDSWTQFADFFKKSNFGGDETYKNAQREHNRVQQQRAANAATGTPTSSAAPAPSTPAQNVPYDNHKFRSMGYSVSLSVGAAFLFQYNALDNDYYFEGMTVSITGGFSFRIQARLTFCPLVYFYLQLGIGIEVVTGLGVIRDAVEVDQPKLDAKYAGHEDPVKLTYMTRPSGTGPIITQAQYDDLSAGQKSSYSPYDVSGYYYNSSTYVTNAQTTASAAKAAAKAAYLETGKYYLTADQYGVLTEAERENYVAWTVGSGGAVQTYYNKTFNSYDAAMAAYEKATTWYFETDYKAFNLRFSGKVSVDVYTQQGGEWKPAPEDSGYVTGFLSSDGTGDTQVTLKKQDGMKLTEAVRVVLRPLEYDAEKTLDETEITYVAEIQDVRSDVYWKGISLSPSLALEAGAGIGVELLKLEIYAKFSVEASFLLGVYNTNYDPYDTENPQNQKKYHDATTPRWRASASPWAWACARY